MKVQLENRSYEDIALEIIFRLSQEGYKPDESIVYEVVLNNLCEYYSKDGNWTIPFNLGSFRSAVKK